MSLLSMFFGWNARVCRLRKKWDRIREKSLGRHEPLRSRALSRLDQVEQDLMLLEERHLNRMERARIAKTLEINLAEIGAMLKMKQEELQAEGVKNEAAQR